MIYIGKCLCGKEYIGETERNVGKHWSEHKNPTKNEPGRHLSIKISDFFAWENLMPAPKHKRTSKNLETLFLQF